MLIMPASLPLRSTGMWRTRWRVIKRIRWVRSSSRDAVIKPCVMMSFTCIDATDSPYCENARTISRSEIIPRITSLLVTTRAPTFFRSLSFQDAFNVHGRIFSYSRRGGMPALQLSTPLRSTLYIYLASSANRHIILCFCLRTGDNIV